MTELKNTLKSLRSLGQHHYYSLPALEEQGISKISRLPVTIRIMLESLLRNCDDIRVKEEDIHRLANWKPTTAQEGEVPFIVSRVILQDFTGVPLIVDMAAMRDAVAEKGFNPELIEPDVPVDLVVDHSVQVDRAASKDAFDYNLALEFERNKERYEFLKWGEDAYKTFKVVPPGIGIVHQVNLEYIATLIVQKKRGDSSLLYLDTLVGTDSHTTMINGLGVVGWGVGGIEAQAAMLGQPVTIQSPEVIGFHLSGKLREGVTATDLALWVTQILRKENVVDKFVEFYGEGVENLTVADRATIANMSPEYGATMGFFPVDSKALEYLKMTGRKEEEINLIRDYLQAQGLFGVAKKGQIDFTKVVELDLNTVEPSVSGPKRPQDRLSLKELKTTFQQLLKASVKEGGYGKNEEEIKKRVHTRVDGKFSLKSHHETGGIESDSPGSSLNLAEMVTNRPFTVPEVNPDYTLINPCEGYLTHGSVIIAAITSCTNTSNPSVMLAAGLLAKKAVEKGLKVSSFAKTSLAPGSRVVTEYLEKAGLQKYLDQLGFELVGYGCTTCIGNSGPLDQTIEDVVKENDLIAASVLSGNRNFEARIHGSVKANFLMSPPLVVAFAIAGRVDIDMEKEPLGMDVQGKPVYLRDIWPTSEEIDALINDNLKPEMFKKRYANIHKDNPLWGEIGITKGAQYAWDGKSTYIQKPPYFEGFEFSQPPAKNLKGMKCLALFGDSVTTDHISPAGAFRVDSPAGQYLLSLGISESDFNSYGSRRGNHHIMMRGTFANVRIKNKMADGKEGGFTKIMPEGKLMSIFDASLHYEKTNTPLIVFAGKDYGMGSSRDWAAKGTALLGVNVVVAQSFERIHRSNLIGMGVLPLEFKNQENHESLGITGEESFAIRGLESGFKPGQEATLEITHNGKTRTAQLIVRVNTPIELAYYKNGGIMPYVLRQILQKQKKV